MVKITGFDHTLTMIRRRLAERAERTDRAAGKTGAARTGKAAAASRKQRAADIEELESVTAQRVRGVDTSTEEGRRLARRVLLESVLTHELGEEIANDAGFSDLLHSVESAIDADPEVSASFRAWIEAVS